MARPTASGDARRLIGIGLAVAVAYVIAARLGFRLAFVAEQITTVWAPTGIAEAALLLWGRSLWPAIWLGAFVANAGAEAPLWTAAAIATGNTLEAVVAALILRRLLGFDPALRRVRDAVAFIVVAAVMSTTISATIGVTTLWAAAVQPWTRLPELWADWWLGDAIGALVVAPVVLTIARTPAAWSRRDWVETCLLVVGAAALSQVVFGHVFGPTIGRHPLEYVIFSFVIAAAVRLGQPATALVVLGASGVTIWNTVRGAGPFAVSEVHQSLILLQAFMGVLAGTGLLLAAAIAERQTSERGRAASYAVGEILSDAPNLTEAAPAILQAICKNLGWRVSALWLIDRDLQRLRCLAVWSDVGPPATAFAVATKEALFSSGVGLPGRVWATARAVWIENVVHDPNFPRAPVARGARIHGAFAFPICLGDEVLGVIECFNRTVITADADLLRTMSTVGHQVGQFMGRKRVESAVREVQRRTRAILDTAMDAIIGMDHRGMITEFNPAAERMFGYRSEEVLGRELAELLIPHELREKHRGGLARYLATGDGPFIDRRVETTGYHVDGHAFPVEVAITRVSDDDPPRFTGFVRHCIREELQSLQRQVIRQERLAAVGQLVSGVAHEINNPLQAILGFSELLQMRADVPVSVKTDLKLIEKESARACNIIRNLAMFARQQPGEAAPVRLTDVITSVAELRQRRLESEDIELRVEDTSTQYVSAVLSELQQVLLNLVVNAEQSILSSGRFPGRITIRSRDQAGRVVLEVEDTGPGILPDNEAKLFQPFFTTKAVGQGTGLGLSISYGIVDSLGGRIGYRRAPHGGAIFHFDLPATSAEAA